MELGIMFIVWRDLGGFKGWPVLKEVGICTLENYLKTRIIWYFKRSCREHLEVIGDNLHSLKNIAYNEKW